MCKQTERGSERLLRKGIGWITLGEQRNDLINRLVEIRS